MPMTRPAIPGMGSELSGLSSSVCSPAGTCMMQAPKIER